MKSEKGITLITVTIYIIAMLIVVSVVSVLTGYFYKNVEITTSLEDINKQYTTFLSYFVREVNESGNKIVNPTPPNANSTFVKFSNGNQYTFISENKGIYYNTIKIASSITDCVFNVIDEKTVQVTVKGENGFEKSIKYSLSGNLR